MFRRQAPSSQARRAASHRRARPWVRLSDEELLKLRFCDLKLSLERSPLARHVRRLYTDLERCGLSVRPHVWLSEEWFSPDGVPGIAMPFYLAHPRLERLERRIMGEAEGGNSRLLMRILRHEAGHALDNAYRLRRRRSWRDVFGPASLPYPARYRARAGSRRAPDSARGREARQGQTHRASCGAFAGDRRCRARALPRDAGSASATASCLLRLLP